VVWDKRNGTKAAATLTRDEDGSIVATISFIRPGYSNIRGPNAYMSVDQARSWIFGEAARHGFGPTDFVVQEIGEVS
jgi:hypothetical protein